jgi:hypothetical protein
MGDSMFYELPARAAHSILVWGHSFEVQNKTGQSRKRVSEIVNHYVLPDIGLYQLNSEFHSRKAQQ